MSESGKRPHCLPGCDRLDGHDGRGTGACMKDGVVLDANCPQRFTCERCGGMDLVNAIRALLTSGPIGRSSGERYIRADFIRDVLDDYVELDQHGKGEPAEAQAATVAGIIDGWE